MSDIDNSRAQGHAHVHSRGNDKPGFWSSLFRAEALVQIVWAVVIGAVAITAIVVYGGK